MTLEIRLLGDFSLQYDGVELYAVYRACLRSFLTYLALYATTPLSRRQVAFAFWSDSDIPIPAAQKRATR